MNIVCVSIAFVILFLALIRFISECFRFDYLAKDPVTFEILRPYLIGALVCSISCLAIAIFCWPKSLLVVVSAERLNPAGVFDFFLWKKTSFPERSNQGVFVLTGRPPFDKNR